MLEVRDITLYYGGVKALEAVSMDVSQGEVVCVLGGNGAGKTSLANTISGLVKPDKGDVYFNGEKITGLAPHLVVRRGVVQVPEGRGIFTTLTVLENLKLGSYLKPKEFNERLQHVYKIFPLLEERSRQVGGSLSGGEQQMLAIGRGLMAGPKLLILDEPTLGLSPMMRLEVSRVARKINSEGTSIILVEQDARIALRISHKGIVLQNGEVLLRGTNKELAENPRLKESYLA